MAVVLWAESTDRGIIVLENWSLYLEILFVHQLGLFLMDPPLVTALLVIVLCLAVGVGQWQ